MKSFFLYFFFSKNLPRKDRKQAEAFMSGLRAAQTGAADLSRTVAKEMRSQSQKADYTTVHHMRSLLDSARMLHMLADNGVDLLFAVKETRNSQGFRNFAAKRMLALAKAAKAEAKRLQAKTRYVNDKSEKLSEHFGILDQAMDVVLDNLRQATAMLGETPPKPLQAKKNGGKAEAGEDDDGGNGRNAES